jgi:hypothetical protein
VDENEMSDENARWVITIAVVVAALLAGAFVGAFAGDFADVGAALAGAFLEGDAVFAGGSALPVVARKWR